MATFTETVMEYLGLSDPGLATEFIIGFIGAVLWITVLMTIIGFSSVWFKRKWNARIGDRIAVNRIGPFGLFIILADALKLVSKEVVLPRGTDETIYRLAPVVSVVAVLSAFALIPFGSGLQLSDPDVGLVLAFAFASLPAVTIVMAAYASNNKYAFMGFEREIAQTVAYEIPLVLSGVVVVPLVAFFLEGSNPLQFSAIVEAQQGPLLGMDGVPLPNWFIFVHPIAAALFFVALLAEFSRNPFDLPEAGSELVAGYLTEYGGVNFVLLFLAEFAAIFFGGALFTALFLGGGAGPVLPAVIWFLVKMFLFFMVVQWLRATLPRIRIDQLLDLGWKRLIEVTFINLLVTTGVIWVVLA